MSELRLSDAQKEKIKQLYKRRNEEFRDAFIEYEKRFRKIQSDARKSILKTLSNEQRKEVDEKLGVLSADFISPGSVGLMLKYKLKK